MIKINIICDNKNWNNYLKNPERLIEKKINLFNKKFTKYKKKKILLTILLSGDTEIKRIKKKT